MSKNYTARFFPGEKVFLMTGTEICEARVDCTRGDRYIISYKASDFGNEGHICVSGNRLYRTQEEAAAQREERKQRLLQARGEWLSTTSNCISTTTNSTSSSFQNRRVYRADEPGDGWAIR